MSFRTYVEVDITIRRVKVSGEIAEGEVVDEESFKLLTLKEALKKLVEYLNDAVWFI